MQSKEKQTTDRTCFWQNMHLRKYQASWLGASQYTQVYQSKLTQCCWGSSQGPSIVRVPNPLALACTSTSKRGGESGNQVLQPTYSTQVIWETRTWLLTIVIRILWVSQALNHTGRNFQQFQNWTILYVDNLDIHIFKWNQLNKNRMEPPLKIWLKHAV